MPTTKGPKPKKSSQSGSMRLRISHAGFESVEISCCVLKFAVARCLFVETRVSSSGETWQAKLIETNKRRSPGVDSFFSGSCCYCMLIGKMILKRPVR